MAYFIDAEGNYPRHLGDVLVENENYVDGDELPEGWLEVAEGVLPEWEEGMTYAEVEPALVDGILTRQFVVVAVEPVVVENPYADRVEPELPPADESNQ